MAHLKKRNGHLLRVGAAGIGHLVRACGSLDPCDLCGDGQSDYTSVQVDVDVSSAYCSDVNGTFVFVNSNFCAPFQPRTRVVTQCVRPAPDGRTVIYTWEYVHSTGILTFQEYIYFNYPTPSGLDEVTNYTFDLCPFTTNTFTIGAGGFAGTITITFS